MQTFPNWQLRVSLAAVLMVHSASDAEAETPHWIWAEAGRVEAPEVILNTTIDTNAASNASIGSATIHGGADFCHLRIVVNGHEVAIVDAYADWFDVDVLRWTQRGKNQIELRAKAVEGPSALALRLQVELTDGKQVSLDTNPRDWTVKTGDDTDKAEVVSHGRVRPEMWISDRPARIQPFDDYTQWKRALDGQGDVAAFETRDGYSVRRILKAGPGHSSWVSLATERKSPPDEKRSSVLIGREDAGLLRVQWPSDDPSVAPSVEMVAGTENLKEIRGISQAADGRWIVNANNSKAIYQLLPPATGESAMRAERWREFPGGVGHGRNDLFWTLTPDVIRIGNQYRSRPAVPTIYSIHGDSVDLPKGDDVQDWTSPLRDRTSVREGHLLRVRLGEKQQPVTIVCAGLRNPFGVAMNLDGERFTYDADAEFDMGAPWYRPTRIVHMVSGADYGWRGVTGSWPPYFPDHADNALPLCDVGKGSPTAVAFGYAAKFPEADRNALYVLDWAYGRVLRVNMTPRGAGYRARVDTFLRGRPLNVTDIGFVDGDMLLVTGGRKTQSNLYRVSYDGEVKPHDSKTKSSQQVRREAFGVRQRLARRQLELSHRSTVELPVEQAKQWVRVQIWPYLADPDPMIRYAARVALEHQPFTAWPDVALKAEDPVTAVTALTALAAAPDAPHEAILKRLNQLPWETLEPAEQARLVRCDAMCLHGTGVSEETRKTSQQRHLKMHHAAVDKQHVLPTGIGFSIAEATLQLLLEQQVAEATPLAVRLLSQADNQRDELFYLFVLREAKFGWTLAARKQYFAALQHTKDYVAGDGMSGFVRQIHEQAMQTLSDEERQGLGDLTSLEQQTAPLPPPRPLIKKRELQQLLADIQASDTPGDARRGEVLFEQALCARCHRKGEIGRPIGPSLTDVASRFRQEDLLKSIVEPSAVVAEKYRQDEIVTEDGRRITGRGTWGGDYRSPTLQIVTDPLRPAAVMKVAKSEIARRQQSKVSPMPTGLLDTLTIQEIQDLLAFLLE